MPLSPDDQLHRGSFAGARSRARPRGATVLLCDRNWRVVEVVENTLQLPRAEAGVSLSEMLALTGPEQEGLAHQTFTEPTIFAKLDTPMRGRRASLFVGGILASDVVVVVASFSRRHLMARLKLGPGLLERSSEDIRDALTRGGFWAGSLGHWGPRRTPSYRLVRRTSLKVQLLDARRQLAELQAQAERSSAESAAIRGMLDSSQAKLHRMSEGSHDGKVVSWIGPGQPEWMSGTHTDIDLRRIAEQALAHSQKRQALLLERLPLGVIESNVEGRVIGLNPAAEKILGYTREQALGLPLGSLGGRSEERGLVCEWLHAPLTDEDNAASGVLSVCRDVTEARRTEADLRKVWSAINQSPLAVALIGLGGEIEYVNGRFQELTGYGETEALGSDVRALLCSGDHKPFLGHAIFEAALAGKVWQGEVCKLRKNGEVYWEWLTASPLRDKEGRIMGVVSFKDDLTNRRRTESELASTESKLKSIFDTMEDGYVEGGLDGPATLVNPAALSLLGYTEADDALALSPLELIDEPEERAACRSALESVGRVSSILSPLRCKDGSTRIFESNLRLITEAPPAGGVQEVGGRPRAVVLTFRAITDRLRADEEAGARATAEAANRLKSEFLANMSHEIRTPMHAVLGLTHLALQTALSEQQRDYLAKIQSSGRALLHIVNDILDFSKVEAGKLELERVEFLLDDVLESLVSSTAASAAAKNLELMVSVAPGVPARLLGDSTRLGQVLLNLVSNAVKFTAHGEVEVRVSLDSSTTEVHHLRFEVSDTGPGIEEEALVGLFTAFSQADTSITRRFGGTGLGLTICRRLVHLMQGEICAESILGTGSRFIFTAVLGVVDMSEDDSIPAVAGLRALVIDDNAAAREILCEALRRLGLSVSEQSTAEAALAEIEGASEPYQLIFIDHQMPGRLNSLESIRRLRRSPRADIQRTLIVLVANHGDGGIAERATGAGANSILFKPFTMSHLLDTLLSLLGAPELRRRRREPVQSESLKGLMSAIRGSRILVAEDNLINQQIARELLESAGIQVDIVSNGQEAVEWVLGGSSVSSCPWHVILMDLQMPVMDGYSATAAIRRDHRFEKLPILAMTAHVLAEERGRCFAAGMDDYVSKPMEPEVLFATLRRWIPVLDLARDCGEAPPKSLDFPAIVGVDTQKGLARVAGNGGLYRSLLLDLAHQHEALAVDLKEAEIAGNHGRLGHLAHNLQGVAGNLGLVTLQYKAAELERLAGQSGQTAECSATLVEWLATVSRRILDALPPPATTNPSSEPGCTTGRPSLAEPTLARLAEQLGGFDGEALETLESALRVLSPQVEAAELSRLTELVRLFRFDEALACLVGLTEGLPADA